MVLQCALTIIEKNEMITIREHLFNASNVISVSEALVASRTPVGFQLLLRKLYELYLLA